MSIRSEPEKLIVLLERHYRDDPEVRVIGSHQLTPEMAEEVAASEFVLFLDAATGATAGTIRTTAVHPQPGPLVFAYHLDPASLLAAAVELYGNAPRTQLLTIVGTAFELGDRISPAVAGRLPEFFERAHAIVESHRESPARGLQA